MKVLIIDDSLVSRRLIRDALSIDVDLDVILAPSGRLGLSKIAQHHPDLVTLDVEMPELDGIETLKLIRQDYPSLPVIMVSRLTEQGASTTIDALFFGANDYVTKPESSRSIDESIQTIRKQLLPKINALYSAYTPHKPTVISPAAARPVSALKHKTPDIIAIGSSTGGPNALTEVLSSLAQKDLDIPIVIAQHTLPIFSKHIADRLSDKTGLLIKEACTGATLGSKDIWLAPGKHHLKLVRQGNKVQLLVDENTEDIPTPSVDRLFRSVADLYANRALAVVLTGMGKDGLLGCQKIHEQGGQIIVQDQQSSVVWGMPGAIAKAGLADAVLPLNQIANAILKHTSA